MKFQQIEDKIILIRGEKVIFDDDLETTDSETTIELNFAVLKVKHTVKKKKS